jgi:hypothetical protein
MNWHRETENERHLEVVETIMRTGETKTVSHPDIFHRNVEDLTASECCLHFRRKGYPNTEGPPWL